MTEKNDMFYQHTDIFQREQELMIETIITVAEESEPTYICIRL